MDTDISTMEINNEKSQMSAYYIGLDFCSKYSVISIYNDMSGSIELVEVQSPTDKTHFIPNILLFDQNSSSWKYGFEAESLSILYPEFAVYSITRFLGCEYKIIINDREFSPAEIAGIIIKKLKEICENYLKETQKKNYSIKHAIVTVPAHFFDRQIIDILEACRFAGLDLETQAIQPHIVKKMENDNFNVFDGIIVDEPLAAAIHFLHIKSFYSNIIQEIEQGQRKYMLIFDLGRETLNVSIIRFDYHPTYGIGLNLLVNKRAKPLGGDQIDLMIMRKMLYLCEDVYPNFDSSLISDNSYRLYERRKKEQWDSVLYNEVLRARDKWRSAVNSLKKNISAEGYEERFYIDNHYIITIKEGKLIHSNKNFTFMISRGLFSHMGASILCECEKIINKALDLANLEKEDISHVIHTGRSSALKIVEKHISDVFQHLFYLHDIFIHKEYLKTCVAQGAAIYGLQRNVPRSMGQGLYLITGGILPHGYGIIKKNNGRLIYDPIIHIGESYPLKRTKKIYHSSEKYPERLFFCFYQNEGDYIEIRKIGEIKLDPMDAVSGYDVEFIIDANRFFQIKVNGNCIDIKPEPFEEDQNVWSYLD